MSDKHKLVRKRFKNLQTTNTNIDTNNDTNMNLDKTISNDDTNMNLDKTISNDEKNNDNELFSTIIDKEQKVLAVKKLRFKDIDFLDNNKKKDDTNDKPNKIQPFSNKLIIKSDLEFNKDVDFSLSFGELFKKINLPKNKFIYEELDYPDLVELVNNNKNNNNNNNENNNKNTWVDIVNNNDDWEIKKNTTTNNLEKEEKKVFYSNNKTALLNDLYNIKKLLTVKKNNWMTVKSSNY
jgi:hypothetical protein